MAKKDKKEQTEKKSADPSTVEADAALEEPIVIPETFDTRRRYKAFIVGGIMASEAPEYEMSDTSAIVDRVSLLADALLAEDAEFLTILVAEEVARRREEAKDPA